MQGESVQHFLFLVEALDLKVELVAFLVGEPRFFVLGFAFEHRFEVSDFDDVLGIILFIFCHFPHDIFLGDVEGFAHEEGG